MADIAIRRPHYPVLAIRRRHPKLFARIAAPRQRKAAEVVWMHGGEER